MQMLKLARIYKIFFNNIHESWKAKMIIFDFKYYNSEKTLMKSDFFYKNEFFTDYFGIQKQL